MNNDLTSEIPAYQAIDMAIGRGRGVTIAPVKGWAILHPSLDAELFVDETEADKHISEIACQVKNPMHISKFPAWIHYQERLEEGISNRMHWTPRMILSSEYKDNK